MHHTHSIYSSYSVKEIRLFHGTPRHSTRVLMKYVLQTNFVCDRVPPRSFSQALYNIGHTTDAFNIDKFSQKTR